MLTATDPKTYWARKIYNLNIHVFCVNKKGINVCAHTCMCLHLCNSCFLEGYVTDC